MTEEHKIDPLKPCKGEWQFIGVNPYAGTKMYSNPLGIMVGSGVHKTNRDMEYAISISSNGGKPSPSEAHWALECFNAADFERDDHSKKIACYWKPVNADLIGECECKL